MSKDEADTGAAPGNFLGGSHGYTEGIISRGVNTKYTYPQERESVADTSHLKLFLTVCIAVGAWPASSYVCRVRWVGVPISRQLELSLDASRSVFAC